MTNPQTAVEEKLDRRWLSYYTNFNNLLNIQRTRRCHRAPGREKPSWRHDNFMGSNSENNCTRTTNDALEKALTGDSFVALDVSHEKDKHANSIPRIEASR